MDSPVLELESAEPQVDFANAVLMASALVFEQSIANKEKKHCCEVCGRCFNRLAHLKRHLLSHSDEKPHECHICEKTFKCKEDLKNHIKRHSSVKLYHCEQCGSGFKTPSNLKTHLVLHTGIRAFECELCGKTCSSGSDLNKHKRTHTGEKPYQCNTCEKRFSQSSHLKTHIRVHSGERPYPCLVCGKSFSGNNVLKKHMMSHNGQKPYKCEVCKNKFIVYENYQIHLAAHEQDESGEYIRVKKGKSSRRRNKKRLTKNPPLANPVEVFITEEIDSILMQKPTVRDSSNESNDNVESEEKIDRFNEGVDEVEEYVKSADGGEIDIKEEILEEEVDMEEELNPNLYNIDCVIKKEID